MNSPATVQRYEMVDHGSYYEAMRMDPKPDGEWVIWEDHCRALEALRKYAMHSPRCPAGWQGAPAAAECLCGLADVLKGNL